jgi:demethylmenaquinone methyltransferase / 2-methoxy-6-polyprenyl-1,4-benzoquinol methylase
VADPVVDKRPARVAAMFDAIAARYDFLNHLLSAGLDRRWRRLAIRSLRLTGREFVVDVCTGTADVALTAVSASEGAATVVGVDFSGEMLRLGAAKTHRLGPERRVWLVQGDATRLPVASASMLGATAAFGIRNVEEPAKAFREMFRVLAPGGRLAILEFSIPTSAFIRTFYLPYFKYVLPRIGGLVSGHDSAYAYLPASVGSFIPPDVMRARLREAGFADVQATPLTFGIVTLYTAQKTS